eukprot:767779-Hanusia_phi.AAC.1
MPADSLKLPNKRKLLERHECEGRRAAELPQRAQSCCKKDVRSDWPGAGAGAGAGAAGAGAGSRSAKEACNQKHYHVRDGSEESFHGKRSHRNGSVDLILSPVHPELLVVWQLDQPEKDELVEEEEEEEEGVGYRPCEGVECALDPKVG